MLEARTPEQRVEWALAHLPGPFVLSSSFGAQAAVTLHMVTRLAPRIPVVLVDTRYLFPETLQFATELAARLDLDLRVYRAPLTAAQFEAQHGRLWEQGADGLARYNEIVEARAVPPRAARARREQLVLRPASRAVDHPARPARAAAARRPLQGAPDRRLDRPRRRHLSQEARPAFHPLWDKGYVSIGDWHSTRTLAEAGDEQSTRFGGLKRECGLHGLDG